MGLHDENAAVTQVHFLPNQVKSEHPKQHFCVENSTLKIPLVPFLCCLNGINMLYI